MKRSKYERFESCSSSSPSRIAALSSALGWALSWGLIAMLASSTAMAAAPAPIERQLDLHLTASGAQHWKFQIQPADPSQQQITDGTTAQDYEISTRLRSNGFLYSDNLLDMDRTARLDIKQQYYARQGLLQFKAENGGKLPATVDEANRLGQRNSPCKDEFECSNRAIERTAAITAMQSNTIKELEEFLASPGNGDEARYLYFFGYAGCPVRIHVRYEAHVSGRRAWDSEHRKVGPYSLDRKADSAGNEIDRKTLCEKYVVTLDVKTGTMFTENLFIPSPPGTSVQNINGKEATTQIELPPAAALLDWTSAVLRKNKDSGSDKTVVSFIAPVDGDWTMQGQFEGKLNLGMTWSFKPVAASP